MTAAFLTGALAAAIAGAVLTVLVVWIVTLVSGSTDPWAAAPWLVSVVALVIGSATFLAERFVRDRELARKRATGEPWAYRE